MSWTTPRAVFALGLIAALAGLAALTHRDAAAQVKGKKGVQPPGKGGPGDKKPAVSKDYELGNLKMADDDVSEAQGERLASAEDRMKRQQWVEACNTLQDLAGRASDVWVPRERRDANGQLQKLYVSVIQEARRRIGTMPEEGLKAYRTLFQEQAKRAFDQARTNDDYKAMVLCASLYRYTEHGPLAVMWLGTYLLNRGDYTEAARWYRDLLDYAASRNELGKVKDLPDNVLVKAALAFHHTGDRRRKEMALAELDRRKATIDLGGEKLTVASLRDDLDGIKTRLHSANTTDVRMVGGGPTRSAVQNGGTPYIEPMWKQKISLTDAHTAQLSAAETALRQRNQPLLHASQPITTTLLHGDSSTRLVIYRSSRGVEAVDMKTGKFVWDSRAEWTIDAVLGVETRDRVPERVNAFNSWLDYWVRSAIRPQMLFENSAVGTLSSDGRFVYAVEDFVAPPPAHMAASTQPNPWGGGGMPVYNWDKETRGAIDQNKLLIFDLNRQGKVVWELGGYEDEKAAKKAPLSNAKTYFLGPPLPVGGVAYALAEIDQTLVLLTLDPEKQQIVRRQKLATIKNARLAQDPLRRVQACHMAYADGVLIVPTNAGAVFGIDVLSNALLWAYPYALDRTEPTPPPYGGYGQPPDGWVVVGGKLVKVNTAVNWFVTPPAVQDGKAVFTAPDGEEIHCVNVADGSRAWSAPRGQDDLYLGGVFNGKVVVVGKSRTRGLSLARGTVLWEVETGLPSGTGAASAQENGTDVLYYVPIREAVNTKEPEICAINVDRGFIHAHTRSRGRVVPGNLVFFDGHVISQSPTEIVAYPKLEAKLAELAAALQEKPDDPEALVERGDYLLDRGDLAGAIADFRRALRSTRKADEATLAKARTKLYEAYTEHFQRDFSKAEEHLKDYEAVCTVPTRGLTGGELSAAQAETRRRRANFLCLVGKGREAQGRLVLAFEHYLRLGEEARPDELISVIDEPSIRAAPDVWAQGRIFAMIRSTDNEREKKEIEARIAARWKKLKDTPGASLNDLRKFVALFGSLFGVGREARLALAERLMDDTDVNSLLEAEQQLSLLRADPEPAFAARALEALARLNTKKGLLEDAAFYYRLLGQRYPNVVIDGKKGSEYLDDLASDKRFLPYLDVSGRYVLRGKVELKHEEVNQYHSPGTRHYQLAHSGDALPFFHRYKLSVPLDYSGKLKLWESNIAEPRWTLDLTRTNFQQIASLSAVSPTTGQQTASRVRHGYQASGHLVVVQLGHMVFGIDPLSKNGRVLWERNLSTSGVTGAVPSHQRFEQDPRDNSLRLIYADGWTQRLGADGPLQAGVVCLQTRDKLTVLDPVTGRELWSRSDVGSRAHVFGDDQYLYVVGMSEAFTPNGTRVFRAYDGVSVAVPDFSAEYRNRVRVRGRTILASETDGAGRTTLRMYDIVAGKNLWHETFPAGSLVARSEDDRLAGVVSPDGSVRVIDVETRKDVLKTRLEDRAHFVDVKEVYLLGDPDYVYLTFNKPDNRGVVVNPSPNFHYESGLRGLPVNGHVYAWQRRTGELQWFNQLQNQFLVLSQFEDLPMLLFTSRYQLRPQVAGGFGGNWVQQYQVQAFAKHNGKMWYEFPSRRDGTTGMTNIPWSAFHTLTMDHRTGKVEFIGEQKKITFTASAR